MCYTRKWNWPMGRDKYKSLIWVSTWNDTKSEFVSLLCLCCVSASLLSLTVHFRTSVKLQTDPSMTTDRHYLCCRCLVCHMSRIFMVPSRVRLCAEVVHVDTFGHRAGYRTYLGSVYGNIHSPLCQRLWRRMSEVELTLCRLQKPQWLKCSQTTRWVCTTLKLFFLFKQRKSVVVK